MKKLTEEEEKYIEQHVPQGWYRLATGEEVREGDKMWIDHLSKWTNIRADPDADEPLAPVDSWEFFIRRIETTAALPTDPARRKSIPIATGCLDYFPLALAEVAKCSVAGNDQHHPGDPLHWDRNKSKDEADAAIRHFLERGKIDTDGIRHTAKFAWRALAMLQKELEGEQ